MGEFTYINIYATKGVEYIWIVGYLLILVALAPTLMNLGKDKKRGGGEG
jgi:predicted regulator of Ras-like GTPase activity (Roadblock/LC7/MglB family)